MGDLRQIREQLTTSHTPDIYWEAYLIEEDGEDKHEMSGIYLFGAGSQAYRAFEIETAQATFTQETTLNQGQDGHYTVVHPEYDFLLLDDLLMPTKMTIHLTSKAFESEMEDKHRLRLAQEFEWVLKERGFSLEVTVERETETSHFVSDKRTIE